MYSVSHEPLAVAPGETITAEAFYLGERIDLRRPSSRFSGHPSVRAVGARGRAVVFRYGAVVLFAVADDERRALFAELAPHLIEPYAEPERETLALRIDPEASEGLGEQGVVLLREAGPERLQIVAEVLAKSVALAQYETAIAQVFAGIEPLAAGLQRTGRASSRGARALLRRIGGTLMVQHKMVGRVEVLEKPELLWEMPALDKLYLVLADELELRDRHLALERKLAVVNTTVETLLELIHVGRSLRVEWYIVLLIVFEILLTLFTLAFLD